MMKLTRLILCPILCLLISSVAFAAQSSEELKILGKKEIAALTDERLTDSYLDVLVELEAVKTFHATSGFTPGQYNNYKNLLKYRLLLLMEIHKRNLVLPPSVE